MPFVKLHGSILDSSIWLEDHTTRLVWITMLAMADEHGVVSASIGGLAHRSRVSREECEAAIATFLAPDPDSRDQTTGERIETVPGGWLVLNHGNYRERQTIEQAKTAARVAAHRARKKAAKGVTEQDRKVTNVTLRNDTSQTSRNISLRGRGRGRGRGTEAEARPAGAQGGTDGPGSAVLSRTKEGVPAGTPPPEVDPYATGVFDIHGREFSRQVLDPLLRYGAEVGADNVLEFRTGEMHDDQPREIGEARFPPRDVGEWMAFFVRIV